MHIFIFLILILLHLTINCSFSLDSDAFSSTALQSSSTTPSRTLPTSLEIHRPINATELFLNRIQENNSTISHIYSSLPTAENSSSYGVEKNESNTDPTLAENATETEFPGETDQLDLSICEEKKCIRKCCNASQYGIFESDCKSLNGEEPWAPDDPDLHVIYGRPPGKNGTVCFGIQSNEFTLRDDGKLYVHIEMLEPATLDYNSFCMDYVRKDDMEWSTESIACIVIGEQSHADKVVNKLHFAGCIISFVSVFILIVMQLTKIKKRQDFASRCLLAVTSSMLVAYLTLILSISQITTPDYRSGCIALGIAMQYWFLTFYFWLNVRCLEISRNVWGSIHGFPMSMIKGSMKRYIGYMFFAYGIPLSISTITLIMTLVPEEQQDVLITPGIGKHRCWIKDEKASLFLYYYGIQILLHVSNLVLMTYSGYLMYFKRQTIKQDGEFHSQNRDKCLKLFWQQFYVLFVILFCFMLDSISAFNSQFSVWSGVDIINSLQGLGLLILVLIRDSNLRKRMKIISSAIIKSMTMTSSMSITSINAVSLNTSQDCVELPPIKSTSDNKLTSDN